MAPAVRQSKQHACKSVAPRAEWGCCRGMAPRHSLACPTLDDFTHIDALALNIERACQAAIDMAMHVVADRHLGVPQSTADAFSLLQRSGLIDAVLVAALHGMVGFRNVAIHQYDQLDMGVLRWVIESTSGHVAWMLQPPALFPGNRTRFCLYRNRNVEQVRKGLTDDGTSIRSWERSPPPSESCVGPRASSCWASCSAPPAVRDRPSSTPP